MRFFYQTALSFPSVAAADKGCQGDEQMDVVWVRGALVAKVFRKTAASFS